MIGSGAQHRAEALCLPRSDDVPSSVGGGADPRQRTAPYARNVHRRRLL